MQNKKLKLLENLVKISSPSGFENDIAKFIQSELSSFISKKNMIIDFHNNLIVTIKGVTRKKIMIDAHCLTGDTLIFAKIDKQYKNLSLKELYINFKSYIEVLVPTITNKGEPVWVKIKNLVYNGKINTKKILLTNGLEVKCTDNHKFPTYAIHKQGYGANRAFYLKTKQVKDLKKGNRLWIQTKFNANLPVGSRTDYREGYLVGFWLAEGNYIYKNYKFKNTKNTHKALKSAATRKGFSNVEDYLSWRKDKYIAGIHLTCGIKDIERGYFKKFPKFHYTQRKHHSCKKAVVLDSYDSYALSLIQKYVKGTNAHTKHITNEAYNRSYLFLRGLLQGYLNGDGNLQIRKNYKYYQVGICNNYKLRESMMIICKLLGLQIRFGKETNYKCSFTGKRNKGIKFYIYNFYKRKKIKRIIWQAIRKIEDNGVKNVYDIEIEPLYTDEKYYTKHHLKQWNNLYFLANGVFTHNSDEVGFSVANVDKEGLISLKYLGRTDYSILTAKDLIILTSKGKVNAVVDRKHSHLVEDEDDINITKISDAQIDIGLRGRKQVLRKIKIGDAVTYRCAFNILAKDAKQGCFISGKGLDDKIGCFVLIEAIKEIVQSNKKPLCDLIFIFSAQEEIGCKGAIECVKKYKPDLFVETDVTFASDYLDDELEKEIGKCHLGKGVVIYRGCGLDYSSIKLIESIAKKHRIKFQTQASDPNCPYTSEYISSENGGIKTLTLGLPLRNMHCPVEIINMKDANYCINLIKAFCLSQNLKYIL